MMKILFTFCFAFILFAFSDTQIPEQKMTKEDYIEKFKSIAVEQMNLYGIPASITLAQGILESGNGNSLLATEANNHFGIKCHKEWNGPTYHMDDDEVNECFRRYENPDESYRDHSLFLTTRPRYSFLFELDILDYKSWANGLKTAGYATNPNYANLLIKNIEEFELFKFDKLYKADPNHRQNLITAKETVPNNINSSDEDFEGIMLYSGNRKVYKHNGVRFIYAKSGDTFKSIAADTEIAEWQLCKYNDLKKKDKLADGQIIYLQVKKNKAKESFHIVQPGETLYGISQQHAIRLKKLCKYNTLSSDATLFPNQKIKLR
jgi:LysM repeat protein